MFKFKAIGVSEGLAHARALVIKEADLTVVKDTITDVAAEQQRVLDAVEKAELCQEIPAGRMGTPKEVAEVCLKLCTMTPYLTGQVIGLDGGWI